MKLFLVTIMILTLSISLFANNFYYYQNENQKIYPKVNFKNYLSFNSKNDKFIYTLLKNKKLKILEKARYKNTEILKLDKVPDKDFINIINKNKIEIYKYFGEKNTWPVIITNSGIIKLKGESDINKLSKDFNFKIISHIKAIDLYVIEKSNVLPLLNELKEKNIVKISQPNFLIPHETRFMPNDTYFDNQWHLSNNGSMPGVVKTANISAIDAWDIEMGNPNTIIAIVDDGMDVEHPDLKGKIIAKHDFIEDDENVGNTGDDAAIHGTSCAGVASAIGNNDEGVIGACPNCSLISARLIGSSNNSANYSPQTIDTQAIIWVAGGSVENTTKITGADIISCSWGFQQPLSLPYSLKQGIDWAVTNGRKGKGCVIVFASGNDGREYGNMELEAYQNIITVGASTDKDKRAYYSNYGMKLDILAPSNGGSNGIWTTDYRGNIGYNIGGQGGPDINGNYTSTFGGTSSATPLVSGVAGLILSKNPNLKWKEVRDILRASADKINKNTINYEYGWNKQYGYGRLNAYTALKLTDETNFSDISEDCNNNDDCSFSCITNNLDFKNGYCSKECSYDYCPNNSICVKKIPKLKEAYCLKTCTVTNDCKIGYACGKLDDNDNFNYCIPGCSTKGCSGNFRICNTETELCENDINNLCWNKHTNSPKICKENNKYCNQDSGICVCNNKYIETKEGRCAKDLCLEHKSCQANSKCDSITGLCICENGYVKKNGRCIIFKKSNNGSCSYDNNSKSLISLFMIFGIFLFLFKKKLSSLNF